MKFVLAVILLMSSWSPVLGQTSATSPTPPPAGRVTYGAGHKLCSDWTAAETKADQTDYVANRFWVAGFMSAYNVYVAAPDFDIGKGVTPTDMKAWMHATCAVNPSKTVAAAATAFLAMLKARQDR